MKTPTATAARANTGTMRRWPPEEDPSPPGWCTEWVASKMTGNAGKLDKLVEEARADIEAGRIRGL